MTLIGIFLFCYSHCLSRVVFWYWEKITSRMIVICSSPLYFEASWSFRLVGGGKAYVPQLTSVFTQRWSSWAVSHSSDSRRLFKRHQKWKVNVNVTCLHYIIKVCKCDILILTSFVNVKTHWHEDVERNFQTFSSSDDFKLLNSFCVR